MVLTPKDITSSSAIGPKARHLHTLVQLGFATPPFVVLPVETIETLHRELEKTEKSFFIEELLKAIEYPLPSARFAIRSAALGEDTQTESQAGQFLTKLDVASINLLQALTEVITDAKEKIGDTSSFSVIVQTFIEPETAGVLFSRDPRGAREIVVEYTQGRGEAAVGGEPVHRITTLLETTHQHKSELPHIDDLATIARSLELHFAHPQDIEWLFANRKLYLLQTRPVTTISKPEYEGFKQADAAAAHTAPCYFEQTTLSENFIKPTPLAFSILESLYAPSGPIAAAYAHFGISYQFKPQLKLIGGDVFVDKEAELRSVLPAYGYLKHQSLEPRLEHISEWLVSVKNLWKLHHLLPSSTDWDTLILAALKEKTNPRANLEERWQYLQEHYWKIYAVNLLAEKALRANKTPHLSLITTHKDILPVIGLQPGKPIGNSISIDDKSAFTTPQQKSEDENTNDSLSTYLALREQARWLSVKLIQYVREGVHLVAQNQNVPLSDIYFHTLGEIINADLKEPIRTARKDTHTHNQNIITPRRITSFATVTTTTKNQGLTPGEATGIVVTKETVATIDGPKILLTTHLTPDIAAYIPKIVGIVAHSGGLLSHMAIIAREAGIPVVVSPDKLEPGARVSINGDTGNIRNT